MTCLETAMIRSMEPLYPSSKTMNKNYLDLLMKEWWGMNY